MKDKIGFTQYHKKSWFYGGKLTRKNFDEVVQLIKRCNDNFNSGDNNGMIVVDKVTGTIIFPVTDTDMTPQKETAKLGDYLARNVSGGWGEIRKYTKRQFENQFTENINWGMLDWYTPTEVEYNVIKALQHDTDMCYSYDWIMDYTKVDRSETKKAVDHLRLLSIVGFYTGLMNDDGEVAGSGFGINDKLPVLMAELLCYRYEERKKAEV